MHKVLVMVMVIFLILGGFSCGDSAGDDDGGTAANPSWMVGTWVENPSQPAPENNVYVFTADGIRYEYLDYAATQLKSPSGTFYWRIEGSNLTISDQKDGTGTSVIMQKINDNHFIWISTLNYYRKGHEPSIRTGTPSNYTVFYHNRYAWSSVNIRYYSGTMWTDKTGVPLSHYSGDWWVISNVQAIGSLDFALNYNTNTWDYAGGTTNYSASNAVVWVADGEVTNQEPSSPVKLGDNNEPDNESTLATSIGIGAANKQLHSLIPRLYDVDWIKFQATNGVMYDIRTTMYGDYVDTRIYLYDAGINQLAWNDNIPFTFGNWSAITNWTCTNDGIYYLKINENDDLGSTNNFYYITVSVTN